MPLPCSLERSTRGLWPGRDAVHASRTGAVLVALTLLGCGESRSATCADGSAVVACGGGGAGGGDTTGGQGGAALACVEGETAPCYDGPPGTKDVGICVGGLSTCGEDGTFGPCVGQVLPGVDTCLTGLDEDCNGSVPASCAGLWSQSFAVTGTFEPSFVGADAAGDVYLAGSYSGVLDLGSGTLDSHDLLAQFVAKFDAMGAPLWSRSFGGDGNYVSFDAGVTPDGKLILSGHFGEQLVLDETHTLVGPFDGTPFVAAYGPDGTIAWNVVAAGHPTGLKSLAVSPNGTITVGAAGTGLSFDASEVYPESSYVLASFAADGSYLGSRGFAPAWSSATHLSSAANDDVVMLLPNLSAAVDLGGGPLGPGSGLTWGRLSADFTHLSSTHFVGMVGASYASIDAGGAAAIAVNGSGLALDGTILASSQGQSMGMVAVLEPDGSVRYGRAFELDDASFGPEFFGVSTGPSEVVVGGQLNGPITIAGATMTSTGEKDGLLIALDNVGDVAWAAHFGGANTSTFVRALAHHPSDSVLVTGSYSSVSFEPGAPDFGQGPLPVGDHVRGFLALVHP